jgi:tRNA pseudouridine55 synthase
VIDGLVVVDKPAGWTSHDVVARCRRLFDQKRVGHAGTLDPDATGVLLVGLGRVTRLLRYLTVLPKTYEGEVVLGVETSTLDASGDVVATHEMTNVTLDAVRSVAARFVGEIDQIPPMVSALKVEGRRLHALARAGVEIERAPRRVVVHQLSIEPTLDATIYRMRAVCSSGTYVRSLAADLGRALGGGAHLRSLRRTAVGSFDVVDARPLERLEPSDVLSHVLSPAEAMRDYPSRRVDSDTALAVGHGRPVDAESVGLHGSGPWALLDANADLLAVYELGAGSRATPAVVIAAQ